MILQEPRDWNFRETLCVLKRLLKTMGLYKLFEFYINFISILGINEKGKVLLNSDVFVCEDDRGQLYWVVLRRLHTASIISKE